MTQAHLQDLLATFKNLYPDLDQKSFFEAFLRSPSWFVIARADQLVAFFDRLKMSFPKFSQKDLVKLYLKVASQSDLSQPG